MTIGRRVYGLSLALLGIPLLIFADFAAIGLPAAAHLPGAHILAYASAALLIAAGLAINIPRTAALGALAAAVFFTLCVLGLLLPPALAKPAVWVAWEDIAEHTAMALGGGLAYALTPGVDQARAVAAQRIARPVFGVCLVVFGISEFVYAKFTASLVPSWLPPSQLVWTYVTGAAQITGGLAVLSGVRARLAALLLTAMYLVFSLIVHFPRVIGHPFGLGVWSENSVNLVLVGAAWCLADALGRTKPQN